MNLFLRRGPVACILSAKGYGILGQKETGYARGPTDNKDQVGHAENY